MSDNGSISQEIRATLERDQRIPHPAEVAITEQRGSRFADRNEQLSQLLDVRLESSFETLRSLDQSRGAR